MQVRAFRLQRKQIYLGVSAIILVLIYIQKKKQGHEEHQGLNPCSCTEHEPYEPIDVVYTWVNGSDEHFRKTLEKHSKNEHAKHESLAEERFDDKDELKFSLRSLEKHMPWVHHVYLVTNGQIPSWLNMDYEKITLVTHKDIFEDLHDLPTFSSPAIEANLHRIPGLSQKFIYFNDDVFLNADIYPEDFYSKHGGFNIYTAWFMQNCAYDCLWGMLNDGKCDYECYNKNCDFDFDDCRGLAQRFANANQFEQSVTKETQTPSSVRHFNIHLQNNHDEDNENFSLKIEERIKQYNEGKMKESKLLRHLVMNKTIAHNDSETGPHLDHDLFSLSLLHTQKLLCRRYGFKNRNVIAHAPIMIDKSIMQEVQETFPEEFRDTIKHRFRDANNLQISLLYSYYLTEATQEKTIEEIFKEFDTDDSETWSDREIRTILARMHPLPLTYQLLQEFEHLLINCTNLLSETEQVKERSLPIPPHERYADSPLAVVTKRIIFNCPQLHRHFQGLPGISHMKKYKHTFVLSNDFLHFHMLRSHVASGAQVMDAVRKSPKKFVCINDNLTRHNATREDNEMIVLLLNDFFMSLFPKQSKYELPTVYRNRFMRVEDLEEWRRAENLWTVFKSPPVIICLFVIGLCLCYFYQMKRSNHSNVNLRAFRI